MLLVKYDSAGVAEWARTVTTGPSYSAFESVVTDSAGHVYAAGYVLGTGTFTFAPSGTATGASSGYNVLLVKYTPSGDAEWAMTSTTGAGDSDYHSVTVDAADNVYAAGYLTGTGVRTFGSEATAAAVTDSDSVLLVRYETSGEALWARTVSTGPNDSSFASVACDASGNLYAAGLVHGTGTYTFGPGVTAAGAYDDNNYNVLLVKYDAAGSAQWVRTVAVGARASVFTSVIVDGLWDVYAAGTIDAVNYDFGDGVWATGAISGSNIALVKYSQD